MQTYIDMGRLKVDAQLHAFIEDEALTNTSITPQDFWENFTQLLIDVTPQNKALLDKRERLQLQLDEYHQSQPNHSLESYKAFLESISYLVPTPDDFTIETSDADPELATMAGPQLVVPINNARYAVNAANARWGSLYDAAYGTDVIDSQNGAEKTKQYNPIRGDKVIQFARQWLDIIAPLTSGKHQDAVKYFLDEQGFAVELTDASIVRLADNEQLKGFTGEQNDPNTLIICHHGLHIEMQFDRQHPIGKTDPTGLKDIFVESALSTIMDCEDSVAAVDAEDKTLVYRNWLGLMQGTLATEISKGGQTFLRTLAQDRTYTNMQGQQSTLKGRSLMFIRNVGHLMTNDAMLLDGEPVFEGLMDGVITSLIALQDVNNLGRFKNSISDSIYIVKPKMHGPEEVAFANNVFDRIESMLGLAANTLKMGIMDEERRTSVNLKACIYAAKSRAVFINTGFLDRTGDEIHTSMYAGPFALKSTLKTLPWIQAYERDNVTHGLAAGLSGKAQIGKGMWPVPDNMADMMVAKIGHPNAGANTAWVPSPTAATLHALHYHQTDVFATQDALQQHQQTNLDAILSVPLLSDVDSLTDAVISTEIDNNVQGILGYVVRWINQGIGCSKVPDINNVGLMEDRATLRISSQHIANWLTHGIVSESQVKESLARMAVLVDQQNANDPEYIKMCPELDKSIAFEAATALIMQGASQPSGYTEPLLHEMRKRLKRQQ